MVVTWHIKLSYEAVRKTPNNAMSSIEKFINKLDKSKSQRSSTSRSSNYDDFSIKDDNQDSSESGSKKSFDVQINFNLLEDQGMLVPEMGKCRMAEEYRAIKRPLLNNAFGKSAYDIPHANLIMVTSSLPGEGKSFTAINLAMSMATEMDRTVLLVEADVAKPAICKYLGIREPAKGMIDYLDDPAVGLENIILRTNIPKLSLLPAGRFHQHATELLASENMRDLMDELSSRYPDRVVIFDSPPILLTSEAITLSELMGQIVLVVESGKTQQSLVKDAKAKLNPNHVIGIVLNKKEGKAGDSYSGYYGYSGYGGDGGGGV